MQQAIDWLKPDRVPKDRKKISLTMAYKYTLRADGTIDRRKVRCSIRGDLMRPILHYKPQMKTAYAIEKSTVRALYALTATNQHPLRHLDIK